MAKMPVQKPYRSRQDYSTPIEFIKAVLDRLCIDAFVCDLAASRHNCVATRFYSETMDALTRPWIFHSCLCGLTYDEITEEGGIGFKEHEKSNCFQYRASRGATELTDEDLSQMWSGLPTDIGVLQLKENQVVVSKSTEFMVSAMPKKSGQGETDSKETRSNRAGEVKGREKKICEESKRKGVETSSVISGQRNSSGNVGKGGSIVDCGGLGSMQTVLGKQMCLLSSEKEADPRSFYPPKKSADAGNSPVEYSPSLPNLQRKQGKPIALEMVQKCRTHCPYCGAPSNTKKVEGFSFLNPPFSQIRPWAEKAKQEAEKGAHVAMLVPASVGANWWWECVEPYAYQSHLNGRLTFVGETAPYPKDLTLLLYTPWGFVGHEIWHWRGHNE